MARDAHCDRILWKDRIGVSVCVEERCKRQCETLDAILGR
jgi:hypothetical protein